MSEEEKELTLCVWLFLWNIRIYRNKQPPLLICRHIPCWTNIVCALANLNVVEMHTNMHSVALVLKPSLGLYSHIHLLGLNPWPITLSFSNNIAFTKLYLTSLQTAGKHYPVTAKRHPKSSLSQCFFISWNIQLKSLCEAVSLGDTPLQQWANTTHLIQEQRLCPLPNTKINTEARLLTGDKINVLTSPNYRYKLFSNILNWTRTIQKDSDKNNRIHIWKQKNPTFPT